MTVELARIRAVPKPWGSADLKPWSTLGDDGIAIGELWFERADSAASVPSLLLKLLFTTQPLSIQVHPDDNMARSRGLQNGKTEAWYILSATPGARVALGLKSALAPAQLRLAILDGSISQCVKWRPVAIDDVVFVPAGTIHAIGAGLVLAEIQQYSDSTFRLFDYGRSRDLHVNEAVAASHPLRSLVQPAAKRLSDERTLLVVDPHFVLERIALLPGAARTLRSERECWLLVLDGAMDVHPGTETAVKIFDARAGQAVFLEADCASLTAGIEGLTALVAYNGPEPDRALLDDLGCRTIEASVDVTQGTALPLRGYTPAADNTLLLKTSEVAS